MQCITLSWDGTLAKCETAIHICISTTVIFWINCLVEAVTLFNTKFQAKNSVLPLHQSQPLLYSIAKVNLKFYLPKGIIVLRQKRNISLI